MSSEFHSIAILGGGLLGGSLAMALSKLSPRPKVSLWSRRAEAVAEAGALGISNSTNSLKDAVEGADLLVLAVPVGVMAELTASAIDQGLPRECLVTDVGSVKKPPHEALAAVLSRSGHSFIGSHPMCGSEQGGIRAAQEDLFHQAACLLTHHGSRLPEQEEKLERFWQSVGCRITWMDAEFHDQLVAKISHLPHLLAAVGAKVSLGDPEDGRYGGGGLRDTTRVAAGNPAMWAEILLENREAMAAPLESTISELQQVLGMIRQGNAQDLEHWLATAKQLRDALSAFQPSL